MNRRETLIAWLNDAYALENQLIPILKNHAKDAQEHPHIQQRLEAHLHETEQHAELVRQCVEQLGSSTSATKSTMAKMTGMFSGASTGMANDELVKNALSDYSMEHFEIACYKALVAAAEALGEHDVAETCRRILHEEEDMADWLDEHLPEVVNEHLGQQAVA